MATDFILTTAGQAVLTAAGAGGDELTFESLAIGDGSGSEIDPDPSMTELVNEQYETESLSVDVYPAGGNTVRVQAQIPSTEGPYTIREVGLFGPDTGGTTALLAIGKHPEIPLPNPATSEASVQVLVECYLQVTDTADVSISTDPSVTDATREYVHGRSNVQVFDSVAEAVSAMTSRGVVKINQSVSEPWAEGSSVALSASGTVREACTNGRYLFFRTDTEVECLDAKTGVQQWIIDGLTQIEAMCCDDSALWIAQNHDEPPDTSVWFRRLSLSDGSIERLERFDAANNNDVSDMASNNGHVYIAHYRSVYDYDLDIESATSWDASDSGTETVKELAISGDRIATGTVGNRVHVFDLAGNNLFSTYDESMGLYEIKALEMDRDRIYVFAESAGSYVNNHIDEHLVCISARGTWDYSGSKLGAKIWDVPSARVGWNNIVQMAVDSRFLYIAENNKLFFFDKKTGHLLYTDYSTGRGTPLPTEFKVWCSSASVGNNGPTTTWYPKAIPGQANHLLELVEENDSPILDGRILQPTK